MKLPIFISEKLFCSFDSNNDNKIEENEFVINLYKLYCGTFNETSEIIFKLLDYDKDSIIQKMMLL
jgi:Ca2+-binding EF-hand superfamily protein